MRKGKFIQYGSMKVINPILYGSLCISIVLTLMLLHYDLTQAEQLRIRTIVGTATVAYIVLAIYLIRKRHIRIASWMLIVLVTGISMTTLLYWGLNTASGIFATSFSIVLSGILLGSGAVLPVALCIVALLAVVQAIHTAGLVQPNLTALIEKSDYFDVLTYTAVLGAFALITWLANRQIEKTLRRANSAEATVRTQKETLALKLEQESTRLRQAQMKEVQQLYKFAMLGQNAAATLHNLSNQLSILNMDINDLKQQDENSITIANAQEGIAQINTTLQQVKRQLDIHKPESTFDALRIIQQAVKDQQEQYAVKHVELVRKHKGKTALRLRGDSFALMQVVTILLSNALDACAELPYPKVIVRTEVSAVRFTLSVIDNGVGLAESMKPHLFSPTQSSKPTGMGIGLYIAKHLLKTQLGGTITLAPNKSSAQHGAHFMVTITLNPSR